MGQRGDIQLNEGTVPVEGHVVKPAEGAKPGVVHKGSESMSLRFERRDEGVAALRIPEVNRKNGGKACTLRLTPNLVGERRQQGFTACHQGEVISAPCVAEREVAADAL